MSAVLITRPAGAADPVVSALEGAGYRVHAVPTVMTDPVEFDQPVLTSYDWVVVTSAAAVDALRELGPGPLWAAVGQASASALRARGVEPDLVPVESNGLALADALPDPQGKRVLLVRAKAAASDLPTRLRERGASVEELAAYETVEGPPTSAAPLMVALRDSDLSVIVFASGSAVRGFVALGGTTAWPAITIGPRTTEVARRYGFRVIGEARQQSAEALAAAVVDAIPVEESNSA
jgi:uroporphyrinogen-III synthase